MTSIELMEIVDRLLEKAAAFIAAHDMLRPDDTVLCAVSGGADSVCMADVLKRLGYRIICAHFNHNLRGDESMRDELFVRGFCEARGIGYHSRAGDVLAYADEQGLSTEDAARRLRYAFLECTADAVSADKLATAHNSGDNAETMLLNLLRGTGTRGLSGIPPVRGRIIRPLLKISRAEIEAYLHALGIGYVVDSTNAELDYTRNKIRLLVMPVLRELNPRFDESAMAAAGLLRDDDTLLEKQATDFISTQVSNRDGSDGVVRRSLPAADIAALPKPLASRVIRQFLGVRLGRAHIDALIGICSSGKSRAYADIPGQRAVVDKGRFFVLSEKTAVIPGKIPDTILKPGDRFHIEDTALSVTCDFIQKCGYINNSLNIFIFKSDTIYGKMTLRSRQPGDKMRLISRNCTKSLKKLFAESKIPVEQRGLVPVIADELGVIAAAGFGVTSRCAAKPGDDVIKIEIGEAL